MSIYLAKSYFKTEYYYSRIIVFYKFVVKDSVATRIDLFELKNFVAVLTVYLQTLTPLIPKQNKLHISFVYSSKYIENHIVNLPAAKFQ
jgi:hypothetical protein